MGDFVAVDVETSGLDPERHDIIEFAMVKLRDGQPYTMAGSLPFSAELVDPQAMEVNGYGLREFADLVDPDTAAMWIAGATEDCHLVGKNPAFDTAFLKRLLARYGYTPQWHHRLVDVGALAWGWHNGLWYGVDNGTAPQAQPPNTDEVAGIVRIPRETVNGFHTAALDAEWAWQVFHKCAPQAAGVAQ